jgi:hypothetical protein
MGRRPKTRARARRPRGNPRHREGERRGTCALYDECLNYATSLNWTTFDCSQCGCYAPARLRVQSLIGSSLQMVKKTL